MRLLVTGAGGFVGRHVVAAAAVRGWAVTRMSRNANPSGPGELAMGVDRWSHQTFADAIEASRPDIILHLAGAAGAVGRRELFEANTLLAGELLSAVAQMPAPPRTILVGSAAEYGFVPERALPASETMACMPVSDYGIAKYAQTLLGLAASSRNLPVLIARLFNPVGLGMPAHLALPSFALQLAGADGQTVRLRVGDISVSRDFIDVAEAARLLLELALLEDWRFPLVNICSGRAFPLKELLDQMIVLSGQAVEVESVPALMRPGEMRRLVGDTARLRAFGLAPQSPDFGNLLAQLVAEARDR